MKILLFHWFLGGHVHSMVGLAKKLQQNNQVIFATIPQREKFFQSLGFRTELFDIDFEEKDGSIYRLFFSNWLDSILECCRLFLKICLKGHSLYYVLIDKQTEILIKNIKPDIIVIDTLLFIYPSILNSGIPWINFWSADHSITPWKKKTLPFNWSKGI